MVRASGLRHMKLFWSMGSNFMGWLYSIDAAQKGAGNLRVEDFRIDRVFCDISGGLKLSVMLCNALEWTETGGWNQQLVFIVI
jgi:hypothetical protein